MPGMAERIMVLLVMVYMKKMLRLKIAQKIKEFSSQYGVDVILTRNSDVFMSPQEKSDFANAQNADAFISLHINSQ